MAGAIDTAAGDFETLLNVLLAVNEKSTKLRNDLKDDIKTSVNKIREVYNDLISQILAKDIVIKDLEKQLSQAEQKSAVAPPVNRRPNYSAVLTGQQQKQDAARKFNVVVKSKKNQTTEYMKTYIKTKISPAEIKVGVSSFKSLKNGNILIQTGNKSDMDSICKNINEKCGDEVEANGTKLWNPRLIIFNTPEDMNLDDLKDAILAQNSELNLQENDVTPRFIFKDRKGKTNLIMEVNSETRKKLEGRKLKVGWNMCGHDDYIKINRCYKCNKYNHRANDCTGTLTCPLCAGNHSMRECTAQRNQYRCINCIRFNQFNTKDPADEHHSALDKSCNQYKIKLKNYIDHINF